MVDDAPRKPRYERHPHLGIETVAYRGPLQCMPTHAHAQFQLTLYDGGPRRFKVARHDFAGGPRTSIIIQAGEPHSSVPVEDPLLTLRTFYIEESLMAEVADSLWGGKGTVAASSMSGSGNATVPLPPQRESATSAMRLSSI